MNRRLLLKGVVGVGLAAGAGALGRYALLAPPPSGRRASIDELYEECGIDGEERHLRPLDRTRIALSTHDDPRTSSDCLVMPTNLPIRAINRDRSWLAVVGLQRLPVLKYE